MNSPVYSHLYSHFRLSKYLLHVAGQWPYDRSRRKNFVRFLISFPLITFAISEMCRLITTEEKLTTIIEVLPFFMIAVISAVKYFTCWINNAIIKEILELVKLHWSMLKTKNEVQLLKQNGIEAHFYEKFYLLFILSSMVGFLFLLYVPCILDIVAPLNESRIQKLPFKPEYFVELPGHNFFIIVHCQIKTIAASFAIAASDTVYVAMVYHACGMYKIVKYRFEHIFDDMQRIHVAKRDAVFHGRITSAVICHLRTIEFSELVVSCYAVSYVIQFFLIVLCIGSFLYNIHKMLEDDNNVMAIAAILDLLGHYFIIFLSIMPGQRLVDYSSELFTAMCNNEWYKASIKTQKQLLLILQRSQRPMVLSAVGLYDMTFDTLTKIVRISFSYFMIISSIEE